MEFHASRRQAIFRLWRHDGIDFPLEEAICLQSPKDLDQHFLGNVGDVMLQLVEPANSAGEAERDHRRSLIADSG